MPRAASLAAALKQRHQVDAELIEGKSGVFKVWVNTELIWDKGSIGRFPKESEILKKIEELGAA